jgi:glycosyltransferase involved in cell wall biosynthesis
MLVKSAEFLAPRNALVIVGNGQLEEELKQSVKARNLSNVRFLDHVPYDQLFDLASGASLGVVLIEHINLSKKYALANKLTEYMASGIAVLASDSPENRRILAEVDAGFVETFTSPEHLGRRLNELLDDRAALAKKGRAGRKAFLERFNWSAYEPTFAEAFRRLLGAP